MRILIYIFSLLLIFSGTAHALKCDKCHKDDKSLTKIIQEREVRSKDELLNLLRKGKMSKLHKNITDEEIEEASNLLKLK